MKKVISILLAAIIVLSLAACSGKETTSPETSQPQDPINIAFSEFRWPKSEIASLLPVPESNIGSISWEASYGFVIYVGETSKEQYDAYVDECWEKGFTVDYSKGNNHFYADNERGYHLSLKYEDENTMFIRIDEPDDAADETQDLTPGEHNVSGFDLATNRTLSFHGIELSFPAYFDVQADESTESYIHYYPEETYYFASLTFTVELLSDSSWTQEVFNTLLSDFEDGTRNVFEIFNISIDENDIILRSEKAAIAGLPGWVITYEQHDQNSINYGGFSFIYIESEQKVIYIEIGYRSYDTSNFDYMGDYEKILETAVLSSGVISAGGFTPTKDTGGWRQFLDDYEAWVDDYIVFMKKYYKNPTDLTLLSDYIDMMEKVSEWEEDSELMEEELNDPAELAEYTKEYLRIVSKMTTALIDIAA